MKAKTMEKETIKAIMVPQNKSDQISIDGLHETIAQLSCLVLKREKLT